MTSTWTSTTARQLTSEASPQTDEFRDIHRLASLVSTLSALAAFRGAGHLPRADQACFIRADVGLGRCLAVALSRTWLPSVQANAGERLTQSRRAVFEGPCGLLTHRAHTTADCGTVPSTSVGMHPVTKRSPRPAGRRIWTGCSSATVAWQRRLQGCERFGLDVQRPPHQTAPSWIVDVTVFAVAGCASVGWPT
jgi:hypothetical protein